MSSGAGSAGRVGRLSILSRSDPDPAALRTACRRGTFRTSTTGRCPGFAQANLIVLPTPLADDFERFCERNPKPCPLLLRSDAPVLDAVAPGADLRTDLPRYRVFRGGALVSEPRDVRDAWRKDLSAFLLGCSFGFEAALTDAGIRLRHQEEGRIVPMYVTNRRCTPAGPFRARLVVSMRPIREDQVGAARRISSRQPMAHGAPVHAGDPEALGIRDLARPDFGEDGGLRPDEVPVFWACGVTSQIAALGADADLVIAHAPGHMLVTDVPMERRRPRRQASGAPGAEENS